MTNEIGVEDLQALGLRIGVGGTLAQRASQPHKGQTKYDAMCSSWRTECLEGTVRIPFKRYRVPFTTMASPR